MSDYKCPICQEPLIRDEARSYENVCEHVSLTWQHLRTEPPLRMTWKCDNPECWMFNNGWWDADGEGMYGSFDKPGTPIHWCYNGFDFDAIGHMYGALRHCKPPWEPLTREIFCRKIGECPFDMHCILISKHHPRWPLNKLLFYIRHLDMRKYKSLSHWLCKCYDKDAVIKFFEPWKDFKWFERGDDNLYTAEEVDVEKEVKDVQEKQETKQTPVEE